MNASYFGPKLPDKNLDTFKKQQEDNNSFLFSSEPKNEIEIKKVAFYEDEKTLNEIMLFQQKSFEEEKEKEVKTQLKESNDNSNRAIFLINIFKRAIKFSKEIKRRVFYKNIHNMTGYQKEILNDKAEHCEKEHLNFFYVNYFFCINKNIFKIIEQCVKPINPDKKIKKIWDFFIVVLTFFNFFLLSIETSFFLDNELQFSANSFVAIIKTISIIVYGLDIIFNFLTGYYYEGHIIMDLERIRKNYFFTIFFYDLLAYIPIFCFIFEKDLLEYSKKFYAINLLFAFILKKYDIRIKDFKEFLIQEKEEFENHFSIMLLYLKILIISHIFACLWYLLGTFNTEEKTWITTQSLKSAFWAEKYLNSIYWSLVTMVTVGYGDITPQNNYEKVFCIVTMLIGFTVFGFTLGNLGEIIHKMNARDIELR